MAEHDMEMGTSFQTDETSESQPFLALSTYDSDKTPTPSSSSLPELTLPHKSPLLRILRLPLFSVYRLLFLSLLILNLIHAHHILTIPRRSKYSPLLVDTSTAATVNMLLAILIRQDYILNLLFRLILLTPHCTPLLIRQALAKVYEHGGLHSGAAFCSVSWFSLLSGILWKEFITIRIADPLIILFTFTILILLVLILITAYPGFRPRYHDIFEYTHRFAGWVVLALLLPDLWLFTRALGHQAGPESPGAVLTKLPAFWLTLLSIFHVALPWLRLRKLDMEPHRLGTGAHCILLSHPSLTHPCTTIRISTSPLSQYHSFACIPSPSNLSHPSSPNPSNTSPTSQRGSLLISHAGNWTRAQIHSPKSYYYTRGLPTSSVLCMMGLFKSVVVMCTGSGVGPVLGTLSHPSAGNTNTSPPPGTEPRKRGTKPKIRLIWSAHAPLQTFGQDIINKLREIDEKVIIIDSSEGGRRDLVSLGWRMWKEESAEAVFVVSNRQTTGSVVYELGARSVGVYGPVWDS